MTLLPVTRPCGIYDENTCTKVSKKRQICSASFHFPFNIFLVTVYHCLM